METYEQRLEIEKQKRLELKNRLIIIARLMDLTVDKEEGDENFEAFIRTTHPTGFKVFFRADQYYCQGKICASVGFNDKANNNRVCYPSSLFVGDAMESLSKDNATLVRNFKRRIIEQAIASQKEIDILVRIALNQHNNREDNMQALSDLINLPVMHHQHRDKPQLHYWGGEAKPSLEVETNWSGNAFKIQLDNLTLDQAKSVLTLVKSWGAIK